MANQENSLDQNQLQLVNMSKNSQDLEPRNDHAHEEIKVVEAEEVLKLPQIDEVPLEQAQIVDAQDEEEIEVQDF